MPFQNEVITFSFSAPDEVSGRLTMRGKAGQLTSLGQSFTILIENSAFTGSLILERSRKGREVWSPVAVFVGDQTAIRFYATSRFDFEYRVRSSSDFVGASDITLTDVDDVQRDLPKPDQEPYLTIRDSGIELPVGNNFIMTSPSEILRDGAPFEPFGISRAGGSLRFDSAGSLDGVLPAGSHFRMDHDSGSYIELNDSGEWRIVGQDGTTLVLANEDDGARLVAVEGRISVGGGEPPAMINALGAIFLVSDGSAVLDTPAGQFKVTADGEISVFGDVGTAGQVPTSAGPGLPAAYSSPFTGDFNGIDPFVYFTDFAEEANISVFGNGADGGTTTVGDSWTAAAYSLSNTLLSMNLFLTLSGFGFGAWRGYAFTDARDIGTAVAHFQLGDLGHDDQTVQIDFAFACSLPQNMTGGSTGRFFVGATEFGELITDLDADANATPRPREAGAVIILTGSTIVIQPVLRTGGADTLGASATLTGNSHYLLRLILLTDGGGNWSSAQLQYSTDGVIYTTIGTATGVTVALTDLNFIGFYNRKAVNNASGWFRAIFDNFRISVTAPAKTFATPA